MPNSSRVIRSDRFILTTSGIAFIVLAIVLSSPLAQANIPGMNTFARVSTSHKTYAPAYVTANTGDVEFDYAANRRLQKQLALDASKKQLNAGKNPKLQAAAKRNISLHNKEIAKLDRWLIANIGSKKKIQTGSK